MERIFTIVGEQDKAPVCSMVHTW